MGPGIGPNQLVADDVASVTAATAQVSAAADAINTAVNNVRPWLGGQTWAGHAADAWEGGWNAEYGPLQSLLTQLPGARTRVMAKATRGAAQTSGDYVAVNPELLGKLASALEALRDALAGNVPVLTSELNSYSAGGLKVPARVAAALKQALGPEALKPPPPGLAVALRRALARAPGDAADMRARNQLAWHLNNTQLPRMACPLPPGSRMITIPWDRKQVDQQAAPVEAQVLLTAVNSNDRAAITGVLLDLDDHYRARDSGFLDRFLAHQGAGEALQKLLEDPTMLPAGEKAASAPLQAGLIPLGATPDWVADGLLAALFTGPAGSSGGQATASDLAAVTGQYRQADLGFLERYAGNLSEDGSLGELNAIARHVPGLAAQLKPFTNGQNGQLDAMNAAEAGTLLQGLSSTSLHRLRSFVGFFHLDKYAAKRVAARRQLEATRAKQAPSAPGWLHPWKVVGDGLSHAGHFLLNANNSTSNWLNEQAKNLGDLIPFVDHLYGGPPIGEAWAQQWHGVAGTAQGAWVSTQAFSPSANFLPPDSPQFWQNFQVRKAVIEDLAGWNPQDDHNPAQQTANVAVAGITWLPIGWLGKIFKIGDLAKLRDAVQAEEAAQTTGKTEEAAQTTGKTEEAAQTTGDQGPLGHEKDTADEPEDLVVLTPQGEEALRTLLAYPVELLHDEGGGTRYVHSSRTMYVDVTEPGVEGKFIDEVRRLKTEFSNDGWGKQPGVRAAKLNTVFPLDTRDYVALHYFKATDADRQIFVGSKYYKEGVRGLWHIFGEGTVERLAADPKPRLAADLTALHQYMAASDLSPGVNDALASGDPAKLARWDPYIRSILSGLNKWSEMQSGASRWEGWVKRGLVFQNWTDEEVRAIADRYHVGDVITERRFLSTVSAGEGYDGPIQFEIYSRTGTPIEKIHAGDRGWQEVLFRPGASFRVLSKEQKRDGTWYIRMEDVSLDRYYNRRSWWPGMLPP